MLGKTCRNMFGYEKSIIPLMIFLLMFCSHPAVEGVLFWGFWEGRHWRGSDAALVNGPNMKVYLSAIFLHIIKKNSSILQSFLTFKSSWIGIGFTSNMDLMKLAKHVASKPVSFSSQWFMMPEPDTLINLDGVNIS